MEPLALGKEPGWVNEQRKKDYKSNALQRKDQWTPYEDDKLRYLLKQQKYGYAEVADILHRSEGAIQRRCTDLGIRERPIKADTRRNPWTDDMHRIVVEGIKIGDGQWGDNAPEPNVKQALYLSHTRGKCQKSLTDLVELLKYRTLCMMKEVHK